MSRQILQYAQMSATLAKMAQGQVLYGQWLNDKATRFVSPAICEVLVARLDPHKELE